MKKSKILAFLFLAGILAIASCKKDDEDENNDLDCTTVKYSTDIAPIIATSCSIGGCHEVNFIFGDYTTYDGLETVAKDGTMEQQVITDKVMPKSGDPLTQTQLDKIQCWLDAGAPNN